MEIKELAKTVVFFIRKNQEKLLLLLCAFGILYAIVFFALPKQPVYYSVLYLDPSYYGEGRLGNVFMRFGAENREAGDYNYETIFFLDSLKDGNSFDTTLLGKRNYFIKKSGAFSGYQSFPIPKEFSGKKNLRMRIQAIAPDRNYSVHFWFRK